MSSQTTNLHLVKPANGETADIGVINGNMDTIDSAVQTIQESVSSLGEAVNTVTPSFKIHGSNNYVSFRWSYPYLQLYVDASLIASLKLGITLNNSN